ncbi:hypothetical protein TVAG_184310 [Trichomonas vaginalis G3]|uniref:Bap-like n=1 Tax=Trichomonas vaginalis (strain ATCC PRA-98 / G3) TaxID=412133 RepID=A2E9W7_TRIV3|nr:fibronectin type 3 domain-containing protein [Trichomonas vaginalis G3]EAY10529.1 hypothetical protein TVAG_184310 [Trichomonas vaginalis G3]KAI5551955.1 fibronectin type 3 domain-containing protein [Trichomonas vaginalis G3]|eukprot:XP_001322752.1 hypothetical protein [Trichomonas vaginalis G3]
MLAYLFSLSRSEIQQDTVIDSIWDPGYHGYANFKIVQPNGDSIPLTSGSGQLLRLTIDGKYYYPKNYEDRIEEKNVNIKLILEKIAEYDYYIKYQITNMNSKPINVALGSFIDWQFKTGFDSDSTVGPLNVEKGYYIQSKGNPTFQKLIIDHSDNQDNKFVRADKYWYGNYADIGDDKERRFTMEVQGKPVFPYSDDRRNTEYAFSASWTERTIAENGYITFGYRIYSNFENEFELLIPNKVATGQVTGDVKLQCYVRPIEKNIIYREVIDYGDGQWVEKQDRIFSYNDQKTLKTMESWRIPFQPKSEPGEYTYRVAIKYTKDGTEHISNIETVKVTRSAPPTLSVDPFDTDSTYKHKPVINDINLSTNLVLKIQGQQNKIRIFGHFTDEDNDKDLKFTVKEGNYKAEVILDAAYHNNKPGELQEFGFNYILKTDKGMNIPLEIWMDSDTDGFFDENDSTDSNRKLLYVNITEGPRTFKPNFEINPLPEKDAIYEPGGRIPISGSYSADGTAKIKFVDTETKKELTSTIEFINATKEFKQFVNKYITLPSDIAHKKITLSAKIYGRYDIPSEYEHTIQFLVRTKPKIVKVNFENDNDRVISNTGYWSKSITIEDHDPGKTLYLYGQFGDDTVSSLGSVTIGNDIKKIANFYELFERTHTGKQYLKIWATEKSYDGTNINFYNELHPLLKSDILQEQVIVTYIPDITCSFPDDYYQNRNHTIQYQIECNDDGKIIIVYEFNNVEFNRETIYIGGKKTLDRSFSVPSDLVYGQYYSLYIHALDEYGFSNSRGNEVYQNTYSFSIKDSPIITEVTLQRDYALQTENFQVKGKFNDLDNRKNLYLFVQLGNNEVTEHQQKIPSNGENNQEFEAFIPIPETELPGKKEIKVWLSTSRKTYEYTTQTIDTSNLYSVPVKISYKPSMKIELLRKVIYKDGDKVYLTGTARANSNLNLNYYIDQTNLNQSSVIKITEIPQEFTTEFVIPPFFKYGNYTVTVIGTDDLEQTTIPFQFKFEIRNPPRILNATAANAEVNQGEVLNVTGYVHDPDIGNVIDIIAKVDTGNEAVYQSINSTAQSMEFSINIVLPSGIEAGPHKIYLTAVDQDGEKSQPFPLDFSVLALAPEEETKNTTDANAGGGSANQKNNSSVMKGLYIGVGFVAALLVILIVIIVVIFHKKKNAPPVPDQEDNKDSDLEEIETQVMSTQSTINPEEIATKDNPLFSSREITHDEDPFEDEFEEQTNTP